MWAVTGSRIVASHEQWLGVWYSVNIDSCGAISPRASHSTEVNDVENACDLEAMIGLGNAFRALNSEAYRLFSVSSCFRRPITAGESERSLVSFHQRHLRPSLDLSVNVVVLVNVLRTKLNRKLFTGLASSAGGNFEVSLNGSTVGD